jgi:hypothetical protein
MTPQDSPEAPLPINEEIAIGKIFLRRDKLKNVSAEQLQVLYHIIRMNNSLRSVQKLHVKISGIDHIEDFKDRIDFHFTGIALYHEAIRTFLWSIYPRIKRSYIEAGDRQEIENLKSRLDNVDNDPFLNIAAIIRDKVAFHFDCDIINESIIEGEPKNDILIGYMRSPSTIDCVFIEPYSSIFKYLSDNLKVKCRYGEAMDWIMKNSIREMDSFCGILERITGAYLHHLGRIENGTLGELTS